MTRIPLAAKASSCALVGLGALLGAVAPALAELGARGADAMQRGDTPLERDVPARAARKDEIASWLLSLEAVTNAPVDVGARLSGEAPFGLRLASGFGVVPGAYLGLINGAVSAMGAYDDRTAGIIDGSFDGGTVWRTQIGFRPFPRAGFYVDGGYALVQLSGSIYGSDVSAPNVVIDGTAVRDAGYEVDTTLHMWLVELGWRGHAFERVTWGVGLGVMGVLSAETSADPNFAQGRTAAARSYSQGASRTIDEAIETYGYVPTLTLRAGYDFL